MKILVTGSAGFIGMHTVLRLLEDGHEVVGADNLSAYYDIKLKRARLERLAHPRFVQAELDLVDAGATRGLFAREKFARVVHLAAQPGVRHSLTDPHAYTANNITAFLNVLEGCRHGAVEHLVYASSSSVYGANSVLPFSEDQRTDHPVSLYAATKRANELMAHSYSHLFGIPATGLRFFTVYGPWGRPDMSPIAFARAILAGEPIQVFNHGKMRRDFTFVDDIVEGVVRTLALPPAPCAESGARHAIYNIGNHQAVGLEDYIDTLAAALGKPALKVYLPMQPGDVPATYADTSRLAALTGFAPSTPLAEGIARFVEWYKAFYHP
ncbi:MAG: NAD-dependent epimerase/dehydratase family protein [Betaproteobacteria bacterium]|nr:NAD-dependent epimerase/dehydratase family protein [Betaproteobacteria bacterium]